MGSQDPEVLVLKGPWGVGKTYAWDKILKEAKAARGINLAKYSYISLFGINSLEALKFSIFEQQINADLIGTEPSLETFKTNTSSVLASLGKKSVHLFQGLPYVRNLTPALESVTYLSLSRTLICIDDFERKSTSLSTRDVLGLLSALKEQKKCKIVMILNESSIEEESLSEYEKYKEKVVDIELYFEPSSAECVDIALDKSTASVAKLQEYIIQLNIKNIRIIKKIERVARLLEPALSKYEKEVLHQALHSLVLFALSHYVKGEQIPPPEYIKDIGYAMFGLGGDEVSEQEKLWKSLLADYGYQTTDEFDLVIARTLETGYLDESTLTAHAQTLNERMIAQKSDTSFTEAWNRYHDSFNTDDNEVLQELFDSFKKNAKYIAPINLNGTVKLFRELNRDDEANELIEHYINARRHEAKIFDLERHAFRNNIDDKIIVDRFNKLHEENRER